MTNALRLISSVTLHCESQDPCGQSFFYFPRVATKTAFLGLVLSTQDCTMLTFSAQFTLATVDVELDSCCLHYTGGRANV